MVSIYFEEKQKEEEGLPPITKNPALMSRVSCYLVAPTGFEPVFAG
jgi:hypothetical protein